MNNKRCSFLLVVTVLTLAFGGRALSQTTTTSQAGAQAVINNDSGKSAGRQFPIATPGVVGTVFPGFAPTSGTWSLWRPAVYRRLSVRQLENMARACDAEVHSMTAEKDVVGKNDDGVDVIDWWPKNLAYPEDRIIGEVAVLSKKTLRLEDPCAAKAIHEVKKKTGTHRVVVRGMPILEGVTRGRSFGAGGSVARIAQPGTENDGIAVAGGAMIGTNRVRVESRWMFEAYAMNDGPVAAPQLPPEMQAQAQPPKPAQPEEPKRIQADVTVKFEGLPSTATINPSYPPQQYAPAPPPPQPSQGQPPQAMAPAIPSGATCDGLPDFTAYFDFDRYSVGSLSLAKIKTMAGWLVNHPQCKIQVEGHTCTIGSHAYNSELASKRAGSVYEVLIGAGAPKAQVIQKASLSYDYPASEHKPENRRVMESSIAS